MLGFSKKRFFITLGLSVLVWYSTVIIQGVSGFNASYNTLFTSFSCKLTGFPIAECILSGPEEVSVWLFNGVNILFWFWVIHFLTNLMFKRTSL